MDSFRTMPTPTVSMTGKVGGGFRQTAESFSMNGTRPNFNPNRFRNGGGNTNQAPVLLGLGGALLFISICLLAARLWSRARPVYRLKMDDWTVLGATVLALVQYLILAVAVLNGLGRRAIFVPAMRRSSALRLLFISQLFWYWSITLVKLSVALLLLRLKHTRPWRTLLYLIMGVSIAAAIVQTCFQFLQCRPFSVYWDPRVFRTVQCFRRSIISGNIIVFSAIQVGLDVVFSLIPITFVRKLNRPRREKIFMCVLMALGLFASCAAIVRTLTLQEYYTTSDLFRTNVTITLWAVLEQQFALIAATIPTLKAFMQRTLVRVGLWFYDESSEEHVRSELVKLGLLAEGEVFTKDENEVMRRPSAKVATQVKRSSHGNETAETNTASANPANERQVTSNETMASAVTEKEFV